MSKKLPVSVDTPVGGEDDGRERVMSALEALDKVIKEQLPKIEEDHLWKLDDEYSDVVEEEKSSIAGLGPDRLCLFLLVGEFEDLLESAGIRDDEIRDAVIEAHLSEAISAGIDESRIGSRFALVFWRPDVYRYKDGGLSHQQARVIVGLQNHSISEVADSLGMTSGSVKSHRYRAVQKINRCKELIGIHSTHQAEYQVLVNGPESIIIRQRIDEDASPAVRKSAKNVTEGLRDMLGEMGLQNTGGSIDVDGRMDREEVFSKQIIQG